jgi:hypothetical protein
MINSVTSNTSKVPLNKLKFFLKNGSEDRLPSKADIHILSGWKPLTLIGYNSAVAKFNTFVISEGATSFTLPLSNAVIESFCVWAGRNNVTSNKGKISSISLKKYLAGLKAWHTYHSAIFPDNKKLRIDLLLKA